MNEIATSASINNLAGFLKYGPIGLAGLMLFLVVVVLIAKRFDDRRERTLKQFMYIGAFCLALSLAANFFATGGAYPLHFRVIPIDEGKERVLPMPIIKANNALVDDNMTYLVKSEVTAIVDVSDAISFAREVQLQNTRQRQVLNRIVAGSDSIVPDLQRVGQIIDSNCPGGHNGISAASNSAVLAITSKAASALSGFRASALAEATVPEPSFK
jgi:hypothetical protein